MEFRHLYYVLKLAEVKSFSKAAKQLYISQPSLSQYISNFEQQLGLLLFDRTTTPVSLTYAGEILTKKARDILMLRNELSRELEDIASHKKGQLTIGITPIRGTELLPKVLPTFYEEFPGFELKLIEGSACELEEWTLKGITDLSILILPLNSKLLTYKELQQEKLLISLHSKHPVLQSKKVKQNDQYPQISLSCLQNESFIFPKHDNKIRPILDDLFKQAGYKPKIRLETNSLITANALVAKNLGIGFWFSTLKDFNNESEVVYCTLEKLSLTRTIAIAYKTGKYLSKVEQAFIAIIKKELA
jgi:DNA-binding transcriptional LysR family regulator